LHNVHNTQLPHKKAPCTAAGRSTTELYSDMLTSAAA
jgi:hypothetical protein